MPYDTVVVGGGPAGAACALDLARAGLRVAVVEKSTPPRYKACGGGLVWRARSLLGVDLAACIETECSQVEMHLPEEGLSFQVERSLPLVTMTMRARLDHCLLQAACEQGAELITPCVLQDLGRQQNELRLLTDRGELQARCVVAADGAASPTARAAGWSEQSTAVPALESEIRVPPRDLKRFSSRARFDLGVPPGGYAWVFPKREHLSIGCLSIRRGRSELRRHLEDYLDRLGLRQPLAREDHGFIIPFRPRSSLLAKDGVLLTGDAAGLVDPVSGEGITWAVRSGQLAAEAIVAHSAAGREACSAYRASLSREILPELRIARLLARLLYDFPRLRGAAFRRAGPSLCRKMSDIYAGELTYRRLLLRPANLWRLTLRLLRPGRPTSGGL